MNEFSLLERVAALETKMAAQENVVKEVDRKLDEVLHVLTKYKGMIGVVWFLFSSMVTAAVLLKDWVVAHVRIT